MPQLVFRRGDQHTVCQIKVLANAPKRESYIHDDEADPLTTAARLNRFYFALV